MSWTQSAEIRNLVAGLGEVEFPNSGSGWGADRISSAL